VKGVAKVTRPCAAGHGHHHNETTNIDQLDAFHCVVIDGGAALDTVQSQASTIASVRENQAGLAAGRNRWRGELVQTTQMLGSYQIIRRHHIVGRTMSISDCDYLPDPEPVQFPPEPALLIVRKAAAMAEAFESKTLDQMTMDASRALRDGMEPRRTIRQMGL